MISNRVIALILFSILCCPVDIHAVLTTKTQSPGFQEVNKWIGPAPEMHPAKMTVIYFWSPVNTKSVWGLRVLTRWYERYKASAPFEIIGISTPEFQFEKDISQTEILINKLKLAFPLALDSEKKVSNAYGVNSLPALYLVDTNGSIRKSYSGEIDYASVEDTLQTLLEEENPSLPEIEKTHIPNLKDSPALLLGYKQLSGYGGNEKLQAETSLTFHYPGNTEEFRFYLSGHWIPKEESLQTAPPLSAIKITFNSSTISIVAGTQRRNLIPAEVRLDGFPLQKGNKGRDIVLQEGKSYVFIREYRVYKLFKSKYESGSHTVELIFEEPGIEIFKASFE